MKDVLLQLRDVLPELLIAATIVSVLLSELLFGGDEEYDDVRGSDTLALAGVAVSLAVALLSFKACLQEQGMRKEILFYALSIDPFSQFVKVLLLLSGLFAVLFSYQTPEVTTGRRAEYATYLLGLILGGMLLASANDILMMYLAFEMVGLCSYILAGHMKGSLRSSEAGFKYVLYGAASSGVMLYGLTYLYGMSGKTYLPAVLDTVARHLVEGLLPGSGDASTAVAVVTMQVLPVPFFMVLAGLLYKIAAFPFHFWAPDVYEGAPIPVTAVFSVLVKIAGFAVMIRFLYVYALAIMGAVLDLSNGRVGLVDFALLVNVLAVISAITMTIGNLSALNQRNVKRLLAYSGIANAGYLMMGVALFFVSVGGVVKANDPLVADGVFAVLFYLTVYLFANLGAFVVGIAIADHLGKEEIDDYRGLGRLSPLTGTVMAVFLFSLVGMPPLAGFVGKFYLFWAVIQHGMYWLAIVAVINSVVSLFYYMRILKAMFLSEPPAGTVFDPSTHYKTLLWLLVVPVVVLGVYFQPLARLAEAAAGFFGAR